ncbi:guanylate kinase [Poseidonibacter ostreae]|uniref:Guanylate kinase n=1 Tax=Poseidonibacter ostreae TaxID=2654171 RepID=A0A6L4WPK9_9BACT|nr:guanylate kinase [Poseidonibacter ostreae]KAB7884781.1 guanylate kinase [Poseidonibacter ostreae]KAB7885991.1 guanylate kinase [Poseidonibacter ostreae]KAB7888784.1 guanylate kinase [Poseidonibacter ostreae]
MSEKKGAILILSGPSGCGKSTLLKEVYKDIGDYYFSISTTTREPRVGEENGIDYFFVTKEEFEKDIEDNNFLEYALVHDNYYGTSLKPINKALEEKKLVIFDIDVQGHELVRNKLDSIVTSVFITTPSLKVLEDRLNSRNTDEKEVIENRVKNAKVEVEYFRDYDYLIINDTLEEASKQLVSIANITRIKTKLFDKDSIISSWL